MPRISSGSYRGSAAGPRRRPELAPVDPGHDRAAEADRVEFVDGEVVARARRRASASRRRRATRRRTPRRWPSSPAAGRRGTPWPGRRPARRSRTCPARTRRPRSSCRTPARPSGWPAPTARSARGRSARPGTNRSAWVGRSAPPDSTRLTTGSRLTRAISSARRVLRSEYGFIAPPRTVGSCPMITHSTPETTPIPVTTLAPTVNSVPHAASGDSSRNGLSGSTSSSMRSRTSSWPRVAVALLRSARRRRRWPARAARRGARARASWASRLARKSRQRGRRGRSERASVRPLVVVGVLARGTFFWILPVEVRGQLPRRRSPPSGPCSRPGGPERATAGRVDSATWRPAWARRPR